jgi:hypothetical protein
MTLPSCTKGPVWESEEGRTLSGFRLGLALVRLSHFAQKGQDLCPTPSRSLVQAAKSRIAVATQLSPAVLRVPTGGAAEAPDLFARSGSSARARGGRSCADGPARSTPPPPGRRRHPRVAARWLLRYFEECDDATIDEAAMVAACRAALAGDRHGDAGAGTSGHGRTSD